MSEWTIQAINHVKQLLVLGLTVTDCVSISTLSSFVCVPVGITSSELGIKTLQSLLELNCIGQL